MPFPNLTPKPNLREGPNAVSNIWAEAQGIPDNGDNTIALPFVAQGIDPVQIDADWLDIRIDALGPSVTGATFVSLAADKLSMVMNFTQGGADQAIVRARIYHSEIS